MVKRIWEKITDVEVNKNKTNYNNILNNLGQEVQEDKKEINKLIIPSSSVLNNNTDKELDELLKFLINKI